MPIKWSKTVRILLLLFIVATLLFIFVQSMLTPEKSSEESGAVGEIIEEIIPPDTKPGAFIQINLRKIAHFVEFALLGAEISLYIILFSRKRTWAFLSFPVALITAFFDETIQIFSGRGPAIVDVWIDFAGFASASVIFYMVATIIALICKNVNKNSQN